MKKFDLKKIVFLQLIWIASPQHSAALEILSEGELSDVSGRDGLSFNLQSQAGITIEQLHWQIDENTAFENDLYVNDIAFVPIGMNGAATTDPLDVNLSVDAFTHPVSGNPGLGLDLSWQRMRYQMESLSMSDSPTASFGQLALDGPGRLQLAADGGIFNVNGSEALLLLDIGNVDTSSPNASDWTAQNPAQLYYRQGAAGSPELTLDNLGFHFSMPRGTVGIDTDGLLVESAPGSRVDFNLTFDLLYDAQGSSPFAYSAAHDLASLFYGWRGGWQDMLFRLDTRGSWPGGANNFVPTQGVTASLGLNFASDFSVVIGEAAGNRAYVEFSNPVSLPGTGLGTSTIADRDFQLGSVTLDPIHAGQGPGGICFGNNTNTIGAGSACGSVAAVNPDSIPLQFLNVAPQDNALALLARDWRLRAYPQTVIYRDEVLNETINEGWALIYTLGDLDGNIYLYPQSGGGLTLDSVIAIQTYGMTDQERWQNGTHFMIGDTDKNLAIGLMGADLLFATDDANVTLENTGLRLDTNKARFQLRGMFGGGDIPNLNTAQKIAYADLNLESDRLVFNLSPAPAGESYLGYSGFVSLANLNESGFSNDQGGDHNHDDGSYFSLAEPGFDRLDVDFRLADISGDIELINGKVDLRNSIETGNGAPELRISHTIKLGQAATLPGGGTGDIFQVGRVEFGGQDLGSMVIPSGQINAALTLKQQPAPYSP